MSTPSYEEVIEHLDELRDRGETNMYGAPNILRQTFPFSKRQAIDICLPYIHGELTEEKYNEILGN